MNGMSIDFVARNAAHTPTRRWPDLPAEFDHVSLRDVPRTRSLPAWCAAPATRTAGIAVALVAGAAAATAAPVVLGQTEAPAPAQVPAPAAPACTLSAPEVGAEPWLRTELFFGTAKPDGTAVTEAEWRAFLDAEVTPRFPDGLTVLGGAGQWQEEDGDIVQERSKIVVLLYPREAAAESDAEIEAIRTAYEAAFQQESVLRADDDRPVCTSF